MRLGVVLWGFICSWCVVHAVSFYESNLDYSILFGWGFMVSLYLFIAKTVEYIKEDFPIKMNVSVNQENKKKKEKD